MITRDGAVFTEDAYGGYGDFDGMCYYKLVDLINGGDGNSSRGIELAFGTKIITNGKQTFVWKKDFFNWATDKLIGDKSANDLVDDGWREEKRTIGRRSLTFSQTLSSAVRKDTLVNNKKNRNHEYKSFRTKNKARRVV
jgi:hypothetical protein